MRASEGGRKSCPHCFWPMGIKKPVHMTRGMVCGGGTGQGTAGPGTLKGAKPRVPATTAAAPGP